MSLGAWGWAWAYAMVPMMAWASEARVEQGNVVIAGPDGVVRTLTRSGLDRDANASPDGRWVAFIRAYPASGADGTGRTELRVVARAGGDERILARSGETCGENPRLDGLSNPQFLGDSRQIVFESLFVVTSGSVQRVSTDGGACRYIAAANDVLVVRGGEYRDALILSQHRYFLGGGSYDWYWLFDVEGREVGPIGDDEAAVAAFLETFDSSPGAEH